MVLNGFICEGPRCNKGMAGRPVLVQWSTAETNELALPDELFGFIHARSVYEEPTPQNQGQQQPKEHQFCSAGCVRDYFNESHYVAPRSPRQQAIQAKINAQVEQEKQAGSQPEVRDGFGKPRVLSSKVIPFPRSSQPVAVSQADGAGDDPSPISS